MATWEFKGGRIWKNGKFEENVSHKYTMSREGDKVFELEDGDRLIPGLIDCHAHLWDPSNPHYGDFICCSPDHYLNEGYLAICDPGTLGPYNYEAVSKFHQYKAPIHIKSLIELFPDGIQKHPPVTPYIWQEIDLDAVKDAYRKADKEYCIGFKIHLGWANRETDLYLLEKICECRDTFPGSVAHVHISGTFLSLEEICAPLKAGDSVIHVMQGKRGCILDKDDNIPMDVIRDAESRGIYFSQANGLNHFAWGVFDACLKEDWLPFNIATDGHLGGYRKYKTPSPNLPYIISAFCNFGYSEDRVFKTVIDNAAEAIKYDLKPEESVVVMKRHDGPCDFYDTFGEYRTGAFRFIPTVYCKEGDLVYDYTAIKKNYR